MVKARGSEYFFSADFAWIQRRLSRDLLEVLSMLWVEGGLDAETTVGCHYTGQCKGVSPWFV